MKKFLNVVLVVALSILLSVTAFASDGGEVPDTDEAKKENGHYMKDAEKRLFRDEVMILSELQYLNKNYENEKIIYNSETHTLYIKQDGMKLSGTARNITVVPADNVESISLVNADIALEEGILFDMVEKSDKHLELAVIGENTITINQNCYLSSAGRISFFSSGSLALKGSGNIAPMAYNLKDLEPIYIPDEQKELEVILNIDGPDFVVEEAPLIVNRLRTLGGNVTLKQGAKIDDLFLQGGALNVYMDSLPDYPEDEAYSLNIWNTMYFGSGEIKVESYSGASGAVRYRSAKVIEANVNVLRGEEPRISSVFVPASRYYTLTDTFEATVTPKIFGAKGVLQTKLEKDPEESAPATKPQVNAPVGEPAKGASTINIKDLTIDSTGATCACGKSCAICNGKSYPVFQMINVAGKNSITVAEGAVLYWVSDSLELNGNGKVTFIGNNFAFSDPALTVYVSGANVTFTGNTDFKEILVTGGAITLPKGNEGANVINRSADGKLYFSHLGLKTEADFPCVGLSHQGAVLQGGTAATPGENWNISTDIGNKTVSIGLIWVILVPTVSVIIITGLVIALIRKNKKA